jgi:hypothetical protein
MRTVVPGRPNCINPLLWPTEEIAPDGRQPETYAQGLVNGVTGQVATSVVSRKYFAKSDAAKLTASMTEPPAYGPQIYGTAH